LTKGVVFDVDGTLIDSVDLHARAWVDAFHHFGHPELRFEEVRNEIGKGSDKLIATFLDEDEVRANETEIADWRRRHFLRRYLPRTRPFPRVRALFQRIRDAGRRIALATSAHGDELEEYLRVTGVGDLIEAHTSSDDAEESKPEPDIFEAAIRRIGLEASQIVVVGDSRYDAQAAIKAGATPVGVLSGGFAEKDLRENGCVEIYRDPEDLLRRFDESLLAR
jgi:phosphoglycolate phosphatase-like HAD superfamily hydrolase